MVKRRSLVSPLNAAGAAAAGYYLVFPRLFSAAQSAGAAIALVCAAFYAFICVCAALCVSICNAYDLFCKRPRSPRSERIYDGSGSIVQKRQAFPAAFPRSFWAFLCVICCFGLCLGVNARWRAQKNRDPLQTLSPRQKIGGASVVLTSDLTPYGDNFYRAQARAEQVFVKNGSVFDAKGLLTLLLRRDAVEFEFAEYTESFERVIAGIGAGTRLTVAGALRPYSAENGEYFIANNARFDGWSGVLSRFRQAARARLAKTLLDFGKAGGLLYALLTASREYMDPFFREAVAASGCAHVLALSGMHLSLIGGLTAFLAGLLCGKKYAPFCAALVCAIFLWFAGLSPSLLRSFIMFALIMSARSIGRPLTLISSLAAAFLIQTSFFPADGESVSFTLSYASLLGIATFGGAASSLLRPYTPPFFAEGVGASIGAQCMTALISASVFGVLYPAGVIASLFISLEIIVFMISGLGILALAAVFNWNIFLNLSADALNALYALIYHTAEVFSRIPGVDARRYPAAGALFFAFGLLCFLVSLNIKKRSDPYYGFVRL